MSNQTIDRSASILGFGHSAQLGMMDTSGQRKTLNNLIGKRVIYSLNTKLYLNENERKKGNRKININPETNNLENLSMQIEKNTLNDEINNMDEDDEEEDEEEDEDMNTQTLNSLLKEYNLTIKYKKGCSITGKMKTNLKIGAYNRFVKFKTDKNISHSPSYYIDGEITFFKGYLTKELLRFNISKQLSLWSEQADIESDEEDEDEVEVEEEEEEEVETDNIKETELENSIEEKDEN